ncbi:MAG: class C beta-lactamase-related serine hydrolase [Gammaproteobacteria bacterium]|nr:MAG: class C beta-lactamase-related serine hydrolase [Gammaproteobacteria bacterium]
MNRSSILLVILTFVLSCSAYAQQEETYDYFSANRTMIRNGVQAVLMCNGLFTGHRTLEQVFAQELAYLTPPRFDGPVGTVDGGEYAIDRDRKAVAIGGPTTGTIIRAAFREGIGCVVMAPDQTFDDIDSLPQLDLPYPAMDPATTPWPNGDLVQEKPLPGNIDASALQAASDWAFDRDTPEQDTLSLMVVYKGDIIHERYADGVDMTTRTRTWSTAKSIAVTLMGMLVDQGRMDLDAALGLEWEPALENPQNDPRNTITLRNVLNMSSGLYPIDSFGLEYANGSGLSYWAGASSINGARNRGLVREPGTFWDYENYDTLLAVYAMKQALGSDKVYQEFPRRALLDKIGMRNTLISADRFHDFILSSQVYTNARDLARFGLLYQQNGTWNGKRLISEDWIEFVRTPAPATKDRGNFYGGQWWLVPDDRTDVPKDAYSTAGNRGQYVIVVPTHDLVIVRRGLDYGKQGFNNWDLTREVLKAFGPDQAISQLAN